MLIKKQDIDLPNKRELILEDHRIQAMIYIAALCFIFLVYLNRLFPHQANIRKIGRILLAIGIVLASLAANTKLLILQHNYNPLTITHYRDLAGKTV